MVSWVVAGSHLPVCSYRVRHLRAVPLKCAEMTGSPTTASYPIRWCMRYPNFVLVTVVCVQQLLLWFFFWLKVTNFVFFAVR